MCTSGVNTNKVRERAVGPFCRRAYRAGVFSCEAPLLVVSRGGEEVVGGAKKEGQGWGFHSHQARPWQFPALSPSQFIHAHCLTWPAAVATLFYSSPPRSCWVPWWLCFYGPCCSRGKTVDVGYFLGQLFWSGWLQWPLWSGSWLLLLAPL